MTWELLKVLYKTYFYTGIVPVKSKVEKQKHYTKDTLAKVYFVIECESKGIDPEQAFKKIERYTTWKDELIKTLHTYTTLY